METRLAKSEQYKRIVSSILGLGSTNSDSAETRLAKTEQYKKEQNIPKLGQWNLKSLLSLIQVSVLNSLKAAQINKHLKITRRQKWPKHCENKSEDEDKSLSVKCRESITLYSCPYRDFQNAFLLGEEEKEAINLERILSSIC